MKQKGKCIIGDLVCVDNYTSEWESVRLHPSTYYRRLDEIENSLSELHGLYTQLDLGEFVLIRFSDKEDLSKFCRLNKEYI
jgi:hypothetical protein